MTQRLSPKPRLLRLGWLVLPFAAGSFVLMGACGDDDPEATAGRDAGPDTRQPPSVVPPPSNPPDTSNDGGFDAKSLYPPALSRELDPRDASIDVAARFCDPALSTWDFCWDFQFEADGITGWEEVITDGGTHELFLADGPPARRRALRSTVLRTSGPGPKWVALRELINGVADRPGGFTLSFSFRVGLVETYTMIGGVQLGPNVHGLAVYPTGCFSPPCLGESTRGPTPPPDVQNRRPFDQNQWYRASIKVTPTTADGGGVAYGSTITVGGAIVGTRETGAFPNAVALYTSMNIFVGAFSTGDAGNTAVELDDVLLE